MAIYEYQGEKRLPVALRRVQYALERDPVVLTQMSILIGKTYSGDILLFTDAAHDEYTLERIALVSSKTMVGLHPYAWWQFQFYWVGADGTLHAFGDSIETSKNLFIKREPMVVTGDQILDAGAGVMLRTTALIAQNVPLGKYEEPPSIGSLTVTLTMRTVL